MNICSVSYRETLYAVCVNVYAPATIRSTSYSQHDQARSGCVNDYAPEHPFINDLAHLAQHDPWHAVCTGVWYGVKPG